MRRWKVLGWQGSKLIYERDYPLSAFSAGQMKALLQRLMCVHLTYDEIAEASRKRTPGEDQGLLEVSEEGTEERYTQSIGNHIWFTATASSADTERP